MKPYNVDKINEPSINILDSTLDFFSEDFDPLKALYSVTTLPSSLPKVKPFDTLSKVRFLLPKNDPNYAPIKKVKSKEEELSDSERKIKEIDLKRKAIIKDQIKQKKKIPQPKVLDSIVGKYSEGPLQFLLKCMKEKHKIKVIIRRFNDIRGFCVGTIEAFDKHMNLV